MRIDSTGKIGMGVTSPAYALDVCGLITARSVGGTSNGIVILQPSSWSTTATDMSVGQIVFQSTGGFSTTVRSVIAAGGLNDAMDLRFTTNKAFSDSTQADRMTIKSFSGYVGINTTTPQYTLDVSGRVNMTNTRYSNSSNYIYRRGATARASTNTYVVIWSNSVNAGGDSITYSSSATLGDTWTISKQGIYAVTATMSRSGTGGINQFMIQSNAASGITFDRNNIIYHTSGVDGGYGAFTFVGYIPNGTYWIKSYLGVTGDSSDYLHIALIHETP
jgi:hypothetical protein